MTFNLITENWIPVLYHTGETRRVGIRQALTEAGEIRQIAASNPMDRVAILRFLLAVLYWCQGNPPSGWTGNAFPDGWFSKLDEHSDCFNLLGKGKRFYQVKNALRDRTSTDLIQEIPSGNNFWHFRHSTDGEQGLCRACCALGLLRLPLFSLSGLPDLKSGINGAPPIYVIPLGESLFETLKANWVVHPDHGIPAWIKPEVRPSPEKKVPLLVGFSALPRRVWLHDPEGPPGRCINCGAENASLIRSGENQSAGKLENDQWDDPHVVYTTEPPPKPSRASDLTATGSFRMDRPWPELTARILENPKFNSADGPRRFFIVGFATNKAKNIDVWEREIAIPPATSNPQLPLITALRQWQKECAKLPWSICMKLKQIEGNALTFSVRPHVEDRVSATVGNLLAGTDESWLQAALEYRPMMNVIAQSLSPGFTTRAIERRRRIANILPDMRPKTEPEKTTRKKGGKK